ncbi:MAG TPA: hypothetical protein VMR59_03685 [Patescibacteria group bacterium]|jgi:hypothetical protein|nr:hypothetical protein [Patescibacteria group bacterium]
MTAFVHEKTTITLRHGIHKVENIVPSNQSTTVFERPGRFLTREKIQVANGELILQAIFGDGDNEEAVQGTGEEPRVIDSASKIRLTRQGLLIETVRPA